MNLSVSSLDTWVCAHVHVRVHVCVCACVCKDAFSSDFGRSPFVTLKNTCDTKDTKARLRYEGTLRTQLYCGTQANSLETPPGRRSSTPSTGTRA